MEPSPWDDEDLNANDSGAPEPIHLNPSMQDSVIGGDLNTGSIVHNHYHDSDPSIPSTQQPLGAQQPMIVGQTANIFGGGHPPIQIYQNPSSAPKVIGILVILSSLLGLLDLAGLASSYFWKQPITLIALSLIAIPVNIVFGISGYLILNYKRQGVHLALAMILITAIIGLISVNVALGPDYYEEMRDSGEITQEEYEGLQGLDEASGALGAIASVFVVLCYGTCMGIIAIPLMIANNGLDESKLFG